MKGSLSSNAVIGMLLTTNDFAMGMFSFEVSFPNKPSLQPPERASTSLIKRTNVLSPTTAVPFSCSKLLYLDTLMKHCSLPDHCGKTTSAFYKLETLKFPEVLGWIRKDTLRMTAIHFSFYHPST